MKLSKCFKERSFARSCLNLLLGPMQKSDFPYRFILYFVLIFNLEVVGNILDNLLRDRVVPSTEF